MIRSLLIRQSFLVVDAALIVLALATGILVIMKFLEAPVMPPPPPVAQAVEADTLLKEVPARESLEPILAARLFGDAGAYDRSAVPTPTTEPEGEQPPPVSDLNLRLIGTTATATLASAIIEDGAQPGSAKSFRIGETVVENVTLLEVHPRHVIIRNKQNNKDKTEKIGMDDEKNNVQAAVAKPTAPPPTSGTDRVNLNRQELMTDIMTNYQDLAKLKPELYRDASGKVVGITANNIGQLPVAQKLGLSDGDVLQTVNNEQIDSEAKIYEMFTKYQSSNSFRIGILRNGKPKVVTYRLD